MANSILGAQPQVSPKGNSAFSPEMLQQLKQFKNTFRGNPKQQVMSMVQQGLRSNQQLQQAMNMAQQLQGFLR
mgnify:FL=1|jgi:hypothetical protein